MASCWRGVVSHNVRSLLMCTKEEVLMKANSSNLLRCWETPPCPGYGADAGRACLPTAASELRMQTHRTSLEVQRLRLHATEVGGWVQPVVRELDPTCHS